MNRGGGIFFVDKAGLREKRLRALVKWSNGLIRNFKAEKANKKKNSLTSWKPKHRDLILGSKERKDHLIKIIA